MFISSCSTSRRARWNPRKVPPVKPKLVEPCEEGSTESGELIFWGGTSSRRFHQLSQCWWNLVKKVPPSQVKWFSLVEPSWQEGSTEWFELILSHGTLSGRFQQVLEPVRQVPLYLLVPFQVFAYSSLHRMGFSVRMDDPSDCYKCVQEDAFDLRTCCIRVSWKYTPLWVIWGQKSTKMSDFCNFPQYECYTVDDFNLVFFL